MKETRIYVFGSNLAGRHGKGSALFAKRSRGAIQGRAEGLQGQSYGIPTKDHVLRTLPLPIIKEAVDRFLQFAIDHPELTFQVVPIGCLNAGYQPNDIAWMFTNSPDNVDLPPEFNEVLIAKYLDEDYS